MNPLKYKIVGMRTVSALEPEVNKLLEQGWSPAGGVAFEPGTSFLLQALVKESKPQEQQGVPGPAAKLDHAALLFGRRCRSCGYKLSEAAFQALRHPARCPNCSDTGEWNVAERVGG